VDTDQIIPASFLKVVDREGLADGLFHGWRFGEGGEPDPDFVLHQPRHEGATVLLVGENFGCGSSREHAPWALQAWGFRVILGLGFADIFKGNAHRNGLLTVTLDPDRHAALAETLERDPEAKVAVDLASQSVTFPDGSAAGFDVDPFAKHCMLEGIDPMGHLLAHLPQIEAFESVREGARQAGIFVATASDEADGGEVSGGGAVGGDGAVGGEDVPLGSEGSTP
jgi:3-isopropylmalate/(R)-2-methylmalate dehydratase small subunit